MKTLIIIRHAKSSWENSSLPDFDRPLSNRGNRDAPAMGRLLRKKIGAPDQILSSPAARAIETAKLVADEVSYPQERIQALPEMYRAQAPELLEIVSGTDPGAETLFLVGHNPAVTEFINLIADYSIDNLPTCGVVSISFDLKSWNDIRPKSGHVQFFERPKKFPE